MALINCSECGKEISNKAEVCVNCGNPISLLESNNKIISNDELQFPALPEDLKIGNQITNWGGDALLNGYYDSEINIVDGIREGEVSVLLCENGIKLTNGFLLGGIELHNAVIINLNQTSKSELIKVEKSVVGRAVAGGLILGPLGAVIGGLSGVGSKETEKKTSYLLINFWDLLSKEPNTVIIRSNESQITNFVNRWQKQFDKGKVISPSRDIEKLTEIEKSILNAYESKGLTEAVKMFYKENNIDIRTSNANFYKETCQYIEQLAKDCGVASDKKTSGCFIASACYNGYSSKEVFILRFYRDAYLAESKIGNLFIKVYYSFSPFVSKIIIRHFRVRRIIRKFFLNPLVKRIEKKY